METLPKKWQKAINIVVIVILGFVNWLLWIIAIIFVCGMLHLFIWICFAFTGYDYFVYNEEKYYFDSNLDIENTIYYENAEYAGYENCTEVITFVNGWFPVKMLKYDSAPDEFIFDIGADLWAINEDFDYSVLYNRENILDVYMWYATNDSGPISLTSEEIDALYEIGDKLAVSPTGITDYQNAPEGEDWGSIEFCYKDSLEDVGYSVFYVAIDEDKAFLMSLSGDFGFEDGAYCVETRTQE